MRVTEVTVEVHEKRNHPHEYGHYDCSVTLAAVLDDWEPSDASISELRAMAAAHVKHHLDSMRRACKY